MISAESWQVFLTVLEKGSFSAAARHLGRVPSAVSMTIANLEAELGLALFERTGREPVPTARARALAVTARRVLLQLDELEAQALSLSQGLESRLTLAVDPVLMASGWANVLALLAEAWPLLEMEVLSAPMADALQLLHTGRAQLALLFERPRYDSQEGFEEVSGETLVVVMSPGHPARQAGSALHLDELARHRQIVVASRDSMELDTRFVLTGHYWCTDSHAAALALLEAGLGWGLLPQSLVRPYVQAGSLQEVALDNLADTMDLAVDVVWSKTRPLGPAAQRFIRLMREQRQASF